MACEVLSFPSENPKSMKFRSPVTRAIRTITVSVMVCFSFLAAGLTQEGGLTAEEMLNQARQLYMEAKWEEAAAMYRTFLDSFGSAEEVEPLLPGLRFDLATSLLQAKQFSPALEVMLEALEGSPPLTEPQERELTFWAGVCLMQEQNFEKARELLQAFVEMFPDPMPTSPVWRIRNQAAAKVPEARLLIGATYLLEGKLAEGADYLADVKEGMQAENRGRATVLQLYGLLEAGQEDPERQDQALEVVVEEFPTLDNLTQLVAFQTMTLQLGANLLDHQEYRKAIMCLQRIWTAERLLRHQQQRLEELESRQEALEANPRSDPYQKFLVAQMIAKVRREVENFQTIENFDAALRFRLATAYQAMRRYREAALILEDMLERMPANPVVESASVNLVQCWNAAERWDKVVEAAEAFAEKFPKSESLPLVAYLRGIALQKDDQFEEAIAAFVELRKKYPKSEFAPRALFMQGFTLLLAEQNPDAIQAFEEFQKQYQESDLLEATGYWRGMAYSLDAQFEITRDVMDEYLASYPDGMFVGAAKFRKAYAAQQMMDFPTSIEELQTFLREHPGHEQKAEALVLLGDALMNEGEIEEGIAAFLQIPPGQTRFFEEGWFKVGQAYKLMEEYDLLLEHMLQFRREHPHSPRVAEALFHAGWVHRQAGEDEVARQLYWDAIEEYGNDPSVRAVEDLFPALIRLYRGEDEQRQYLARLRDLREDDSEGNSVLTMRSLWAEASALQRSDPEAARLLLLEAARLAKVQTTNPMVLADFAQARMDSGDRTGAAEVFQDLIKWNPRAPQKDRALAQLGLMEKAAGRNRAALDYFERFARETMGSFFTGKVLLAKAELEMERGQNAAAKQSLEELLSSDSTTGQEKAEALFQLGEIHMAENKPGLAVPYYQRIYIMHGRWRDWVAKAYLRSGEAFEKLADREAARRTYAELIDHPELADFAETAEAKKRLDKLGGPPPQEPVEEQARS